MTGKQATLGETSGEEGGGEVDAGREPGGSDPVTTFPYPDIGDRLDSREVEEEFEWVPHGERDEGPNLAAGPWICHSCGDPSEDCYRCSECGADLAGSTGSTPTTSTKVGK